MQVAPVSGDMLVKLALGVAVIGAAVWAVRSMRAALGDAADAAAEWAENTTQAGLEQATTDSTSLGAIVAYGGPLNPFGRLVPGMRAVYDWATGPSSSGGATGSW